MYRCITLRSYAIRGAAQSIQQPHAHSHMRTIATVGPRLSAGPTGPTIDKAEGVYAKKGGDRNVLYISGGLAAAAALWYYYANAESAHPKGREGPGLGKSAEGGLERTVSDATRSAKERSQDIFKSGDAKYQEVKAEAEAKVGATKDQIGQTFERGKQRVEAGRDQASHRAAEVQSTVEQKVDAAKSSGWGLLNWGKSRTQAAADDLKRRVDESQETWNSRFEEAKKKAAEKGEDIKQGVDEKEEEFLNRIAKSIERR
ncbi:hypothetical protein F5148DRAFT_635844 [Russula earlei]|uniref:Uncharacterized protein n=1 Tax=Russula earlei TaxID=71964 RepID=A0ACC0UG83_9AGAM|nr:hypothetical protein F5148DRAFT_635844 [Russula earlei]